MSRPGTILPGSIIALVLEDETPTAKVTYVNAMEMTVKLCGKNQFIVINNWVQAIVQRRMIIKLKTGIIDSQKSIVISEFLPEAPSWLRRFFGRMSGYQYRRHHRAMHVVKDNEGDPRMARRWCRRKKITGKLYADGFFLSSSGLWVYLDHHNALKELIWKK